MDSLENRELIQPYWKLKASPMKISIPLDMQRSTTVFYSSKPSTCDSCGGSTLTVIHFMRHTKQNGHMFVCPNCANNHDLLKTMEGASVNARGRL